MAGNIALIKIKYKKNGEGRRKLPSLRGYFPGWIRFPEIQKQVAET